MPLVEPFPPKIISILDRTILFGSHLCLQVSPVAHGRETRNDDIDSQSDKFPIIGPVESGRKISRRSHILLSKNLSQWKQLYFFLFWPWQFVAVGYAGKVLFDWEEKPSGTSSMNTFAVNILMCVRPSIEIFLSRWCLRDLKPSLGKALWRKNIPVHREMWYFTVNLILY